MSNDSIEAWLRSVSVAKQYQKVFQASLKSASKFFTCKKKSTTAPACTASDTTIGTHKMDDAISSSQVSPSEDFGTGIHFEEIDPGQGIK